MTLLVVPPCAAALAPWWWGAGAVLLGLTAWCFALAAGLDAFVTRRMRARKE